MKKWIAILLVAVMALSVVACAGKKDEKKDDAAANAGQTQNNELQGAVSQEAESETVAPKSMTEMLIGTWVLDAEALFAELGEEERSYMEALGMTAANYKIEYTFNANGSGKAQMDMFGESQTVDFTYKCEDGKLIMTPLDPSVGETVEVDWTIDDNKLIMSADGETMSFNRK